MVARSAREIPIPASAAPLLERLWAAGHAGYLVGGTVRDLLLGLAPQDVVDIATDATPDKLQELFPEGRYEN